MINIRARKGLGNLKKNFKFKEKFNCYWIAVCKLLRVNASQIMDALTAVSVVTHGEIITRNNSLEEAEETRDAMAKGLYGRLFDWIVNQINRHLSFGRLI